jgi:hypothetical protein
MTRLRRACSRNSFQGAQKLFVLWSDQKVNLSANWI